MKEEPENPALRTSERWQPPNHAGAMSLTLTGQRIPTRSLPVSVARLAADSVFGAALVISGIVLIFGQTPSTERVCYALIALLVVPSSVVHAWWRRDDEPEKAWPTVLATFSSTVVAILVARIYGGSHTSAWLLVALLLGRLVAHLAARFAPQPKGRLDMTSYMTLPLLLAVAAACCNPAGVVNFKQVALAFGVAIVVWTTLTRIRLTALTRTHVALDVLVGLLVLLAVFQMSSTFTPSQIENQAYFLGPASDVLHGRPALVDTFSQYGVGMLYALAGVFSVVPIGFGVLSLVIALGTSLMYLCIYAVLRLSIESRLIVVLGGLTAVVIYIYAASWWLYVDYPSTGVLRFGPPWIVVLLAVAGARVSNPAAARRLKAAELVVVAAAAVWSLESGAYSVGAAVAIALLDSAVLDASVRVRVRAAVQRVLALALACVGALVLFTVLTRVFAGQWPDWGPYLSFVSEYTVGGLGVVPIQQWSPGIAVGAMYGVSAAAAIGLVVLQPSAVRARPAAFRAVAGITVMGAIQYTYFLGRAAPSNLIHIAAPAVALAFIWIGLAVAALGARKPVAVLVAAATFVGALIVIGDGRNFSVKFPYSALGALIEHPGTAVSTFTSLADNPVFDPDTPPLVAFIRSMHPGDRQLTVVAFPIVQTEALVRLGRATAAGANQMCQEAISHTGDQRILKEVRELKPGGLLVTDFTPQLPLLPLQAYELAEIRARFQTQRIAQSSPIDGYKLVRQRITWHGGGSLKQPPPNVSGKPGCG
jgi:hypothetical protein